MLRSITVVGALVLLTTGGMHAAELKIETDADLARVERDLENRILRERLLKLNVPANIKLDPELSKYSLDELMQAQQIYSIHRGNFVTLMNAAPDPLRDRNNAATGALIPDTLLTPDGTGGFRLDVSRKAIDAFNLCEIARSDIPFANEPAVANCAATLVAPRLAVTAGHCVKNAKWTSLYLVFGYQPVGNPPRVPETYAATDVYCIVDAKEQPSSSERGQDWAILILDRTVNRKPVTVRLSGDIGDTDELYTIGCPLGTPLIASEGATVTDNTEDNTFTADIDTLERSSGSPVFHATTHDLEGIFVRGDEWLETPLCRLLLHCPPGDESCAHEEVTRIRCLPLTPDTEGTLMLTQAHSHPCRGIQQASN